jgi:hypothetical protein
MDNSELRGIIVEKSSDVAASLNQLLLPDVVLTEVSIRNNLHKTFQSVKEQAFDICFIGECFTGEDLTAFFNDVRAVGKETEVLFVQVKEAIEEGFSRESVEELGFATVISRRLTESDRVMLVAELQRFLAAREIVRKKVDVDASVRLLLLELDRVYRNRKRGLGSGFRRAIVASYMAEQVSFHGDVLDGFLEALERHTAQSLPEKNLRVVLPQIALERQLPKIEDGEYVGVSERVFGMLREKFGVAVDDETVREVARSEAAAPGSVDEVKLRAEQKLKERLKDLGLDDA